MRTSVDPRIIQAAAQLLAEAPELSNAELLRRLALSLGPEVTRTIPVTRVERRLRRPALRLLHTGRTETDGSRPQEEGNPSLNHDLSTKGGVGTERSRSRGQNRASPDEVQSKEGRAFSKGPAPETDRTTRPRSDRIAKAVDDALVEAFSLGARSETGSQVAENFRELGVLRRKVQEHFSMATGPAPASNDR